MTTQLTQPVLQTAASATLDSWEMQITRKADLSVDVPESQLLAFLVFRDANGNIVDRRKLQRPGNQLPAAVATAVKNLHEALTNAARNAGLLPAGTDTPDF